jgi:glycosylphosphatidylinositol transamidase (GPIT) subunit GPI8
MTDHCDLIEQFIQKNRRLTLQELTDALNANQLTSADGRQWTIKAVLAMKRDINKRSQQIQSRVTPPDC